MDWMYPLPRKGLAHPCGIAIDLYHGIAPGQQIALKLGGYTKGEGIEAGVAPRIRLGLTDQHRRQKIERIKGIDDARNRLENDRLSQSFSRPLLESSPPLMH